MFLRKEVHYLFTFCRSFSILLICCSNFVTSLLSNYTCSFNTINFSLLSWGTRSFLFFFGLATEKVLKDLSRFISSNKLWTCLYFSFINDYNCDVWLSYPFCSINTWSLRVQKVLNRQLTCYFSTLPKN